MQQSDIESIDKYHMGELIRDFPSQIMHGWHVGQKGIQQKSFELIKLNQLNNIVFNGMGGSAIGGDIINSNISDQLSIPFIVNRAYNLPGFCNNKTLFIASSYSGNTEETLAATKEAINRKCSIMCITSGGALAEISQTNQFPIFRLDGGLPPRAALGYSLGVLIYLFSHFNINSISEKQLSEMTELISYEGAVWGNVESADNHALSLAQQLSGHIPVITSAVNSMDAVGLRWKTQFNENSKCHAFFNAIPEMNHNEIVGWKSLKETHPALTRLYQIILKTSHDHTRIQLRMNITQEIINSNQYKVVEITAKGDSLLSQSLYLIHLGDWISYYLAILYGQDPTEITNIDILKQRMAQHSIE